MFHILFHFTSPLYITQLFNMQKVNNKQNNEVPRKRKSLTAAQKKEICLKKISTPSLKQKELAIVYDVSEGMISDILKAKDRWPACYRS